MLKSLPGGVGVMVSIAPSLAGTTGARAQIPCPGWSDCLAVNHSGFIMELLVPEVAETIEGSQFVYSLPNLLPIDTSQFGKAIELTDASGLSDIVGIAQR